MRTIGDAGPAVAGGRGSLPLLQLALARAIHPFLAASRLEALGLTAAPYPVLVPDTGETLTPREVEVLRLLATGASNRQISEQLVITERTVKTRVTNILHKLNVSSRTQASARARDLRIV